ncbi:MAG: HNH endonuclease [Peptostreptococcaceae bacterium]|nr:HNH endonuclease [Peptostreptococcaceae bacterium]
MATKRKALSKKTRFEVFKRDLFTCQYCGKKAPDVILEVDHIKPVAKGGDNSIENLVSACYDCNHGKSDRVLSDLSEVEKSRLQIEQLQEKKNMVDLILEWKQSVRNAEEYATDKIEHLFFEEIDIKGRGFLKEYRRTVGKTIKDCGLDLVVDAVYIAIGYYYKGNIENIDKTLSKICGIARNKYDEINNPDKASFRRVMYATMKRFYITAQQFHSNFTYGQYEPCLEEEYLTTINKAKSTYELFEMFNNISEEE